jgi:streptogramin lyase
MHLPNLSRSIAVAALSAAFATGSQSTQVQAAVTFPFGWSIAASTPQRLYVFDDDSVTGGSRYVEYSVPGLALLEESQPLSFTSTFGVAPGGALYFTAAGVNGAATAWELPLSTGSVAAKPLFTYAEGSPTVVNRAGDIYITDYSGGAVDEFTQSGVKGVGAKAPVRVLTGGTIGSGSGQSGPTYSGVDAAGNVWVAVNGIRKMTVFGPTGTKPIGEVTLGTTVFAGFLDFFVDGKGAVYLLHSDPAWQGFTGKGSCTLAPDPAPAYRAEIMEKYVDGRLVQRFYNSAYDNTETPAHVAVASDGRIYVSQESSVLDFAPDASCPTDALQFKTSNRVFAPIAVDAARNLYVSDSTTNRISEYPPATTKPIGYLVQPKPLVHARQILIQ